MNRIYHILLIVLVASLGLVACSESYPTAEYHQESAVMNFETPDDNRPVPLFVYVDRQSFFSLSSTRGAGHFDPISTSSTDDDKDRYRKTPFYLFAFRDPKSTSTTYSQTLLHTLPDLTYTMTPAPGGKPDDEKLNCLMDGPNFYEGFKTTLDEKGGMYLDYDELPKDNEDGNNLYYDNIKTKQFYYPNVQDVGYNFFCYSIDDVNSTGSAYVHRTPESIWYDLKIDGTQDIMCGYAPHPTEDDFTSGTGRYNRITLTDAEKRRILDIGNYCTYAGHRNIHPFIAMRHQLTRLEFVAYPGEKEADYVTIDQVIVYAPNTGKLVVADRDTSKIGFTPDVVTDQSLLYPFMLHEGPKQDANGQWKCSVMPEKTYRTNPWDKAYEDKTLSIYQHGDPVRLGGEGSCMLLPEQEEFLIKLVATYDSDPNDPTKKRTFESVYRLKPQENKENMGEDGKYKFRSGRYYTIAVAVYGLKEIKVFSQIKDWEQGASVEIDPDNPIGGEIY